MLLGIAHAEHHETTRRIVLFPCRSAKTLSAGRTVECHRIVLTVSARTPWESRSDATSPTGGCHGHAPERRPTSTRRHAAPGDRCNPSRRVVPSGASWPSDHPRRPPCHTPGDRIARESHCCCEPPAPKPGDVYAEGRTCLPRSRMGAVPLISGAGRYSSCHHRRSRQSMTLSITHRIVPSCPRPKG